MKTQGAVWLALNFFCQKASTVLIMWESMSHKNHAILNS